MTPLQRAADAVATLLADPHRYQPGMSGEGVYKIVWTPGKPYPVVEEVAGAKSIQEAWGRDLARAVLTAIREPSEGMVLDGISASDDRFSDGSASTIWQAMIDAALAEGE